jgi:cobaltochelatase CobN
LHLSIKHSQAIEDADLPMNPQQSPADILLLSFTDSDLACMAAAAKNAKNLRLSSLALLKHPLSVDLYIEQVAAHAKVILVRLLGGYDWWKYGAEEFAKLARAKNIKLIMVSGCQTDLRLTELSTAPKSEVLAVENCLAQGGEINATRVLDYLQGGDVPVAEIINSGALYKFVMPTQIGKQFGCATIIFYRAHYLAADVAPIDAMLAAFAERGIAARSFMLTSLKDISALALLKAELSENPADIILDATSFSAGSGAHPLAYLDMPILQVALANMSLADWQESKRGLSTSDMAMQVVLPEADGRIFTRAISFKSEGEKHELLEFTRNFHNPEIGRVEYVAELAVAWIKLRKKENVDKKIALILSDYPQREGRKGYAVGLDAPQSVEVILRMLEADGYLVDGGRWTLDGEDKKEKYHISDYKNLFAQLPTENQQAVLAAWGEPQDSDFEIKLQICGNIVVALQPDRGSFADKKTGYHDSTTPPCHSYLAFYWWLRDEFRMDALIHLGTHGNLEWLPAKTVALSNNCWQEIILGATPVIYPYIVSDAGEAAQAKRRISAVIISHLTPPLQQVNLTPELVELETLTDEYSSADGLDGRRMKYLRDEIIFRAKKTGMTFAGSDDAAVMTALESHLCDIKEQRVGDGLHVFGGSQLNSISDGEDITKECAANERKNLLAGLSGKFIMPSAGGAPSRGRLDILPTGRNLIGVDPRTIPTKTASVIGTRAATDFIRRYMQDNGDYPKNIIMDLWGSATLRTGGDEIAQALCLMGVMPTWDENSQHISGFEIIPDDEMPNYNMDWQRIDVTIRISGLFRDMFPNLILLFDDAVQAIARLQGKQSAWRIFGNAPSAYGAGTTELIDSGAWKTRDDLGQAYLDASHFAYGRGADGVLAAADLKARVKNSDALIHVQDLREVDVLSGADFADSEGGFAAAADMLGAKPALYHIDTTNPDNIKTRKLSEEISLTLQARAINPQWIAGQMRHGYAGAAAIADVVDNLFAFAATSDTVTSSQFDLVADCYLHDEQVREFLEQKNPDALKAITARLNEAIERGLWLPLRNSTVELLGDIAA